MSVTFWALMLAMLFIAIGLLILPLVRVSSSSSIAYKESNLALYNSKLKELENDLEEGRIEKQNYLAAVAELDRELLVDVPDDNKESAAINYGVTAKPQPAIAMLVAVFLPAFVFLVYMQLGMHADNKAELEQVATQEEHEESIDALIQKLADKLNSVGGTVEEWAMLGRAYKQIQRYAESSAAFAQAIRLQPSVRLYLEQAEALALLNNKSFVGEPRDLVMKALALAPNNVNALWFGGVAEFQSGNYGETIDLLIQLSAEANADPEIGDSIRFYVTAARENLIAQGEDIPPVDELLKIQEPVTQAAENTVAGARLEVSVDINKEIRGLFDEDTVVFVYAKAKQGPKMPLAAQRLSLSALPASVVLDDSMAMMAGMNISAFDSVVVSARISKAGSAIAQPGDYIGSVLVDNVSTTEKLQVLISNIVK